MGLDLRRRFLVESRHIVDIFDENLADPGAVEAGAYVPDPLLAEVGRGRTGSMRDIVATIQAEQDVIIRAPLESCIVVQGGPAPARPPSACTVLRTSFTSTGLFSSENGCSSSGRTASSSATFRRCCRPSGRSPPPS